MKQFRVIISGGGTGGHIFPALAIAKALEKKVSNIEILFVGATGKMEMSKIPAEGYKIKGLWISGLQRRITIKNLLFPFKVISSLLGARKIIKKFNADVAIGTGGYASGPLLYMAAKSGIPTLVQEQNSYPGITNKVLSKVVDKVCVAYDNMEQFFSKNKIIFTGNPIRQDVLEFASKKQMGISHFNLEENKKTVLVIGGSLGARTINEAIDENISFFVENNLNLIWQTGISYQKKAEKSVREKAVKGINAYTFIKEMDKAYGAADIIISRAGAIAISELCCISKPTILIPSPNVSEDHQTKNAQAVVNKKAALLVKDNEVGSKLVNCLRELYDDTIMQKELIKNIKNLAVMNAADKIANEALILSKK
ncbi:MAG TPA: undecaprenyldiphospho-muramoylpentapeptide beta-N-acetylglucosaminyltransferase [Flavobacteriales bacterium]|jgi:UDP-N-acetylglucosamine--N-acetylmuramyl-(pentapeptide) pyrophosphoryl-undecaprenol N-acetylglucosamine transferase|nr:undecaprenyldiphospho-muramoylpentapeptide beta-N-acetylglucosaminyltransferase [Flavobacteriales bacterium]HJN64256.1 undecaprenyldiphospho-muramoylpentapeptide beta-N-acetylglucosaminyltransferase [Flavobacteriales bacterium]|tara:strand:- start:5723 stop:6826 length:1104 start_codon:yes stop_codon:yes gene_type:complete